LRHTARGDRLRGEESAMTTLATILANTVRHHGPRPAVHTEARSFTWAEFGDRARRLAGFLRAQGIAPGERVGALLRNGFRGEELRWAAHWAGIVLVPVNWRLAAPEVAQILDDADCRLVFCQDEFAALFDHQALAGWRSRLFPVATVNDPDNAAVYEAAVASAAAADMADADEADDAVILYTGGTTGRSKGVRLSHRALVANALQIGLGVRARPDDVLLHVAPYFHSVEMVTTPWTVLGASHVYMDDYSAPEMFRLIERFRLSAIIAVPTIVIDMITQPDFAARDFGSLRTMCFGGSPMAPEWQRRAFAAFPHVDLVQAYGMTETAPVMTLGNSADIRARLAGGEDGGPLTAAGKPVAAMEMRVADEAGNILGPGETGEIQARGPNLMNGYLNMPDETARALAGGWMRTGDVGHIDAEGYVYIHDRIKDMVITGGENVYSGEVEAALTRHPQVHEAAVIGVPDDKYGEALLAVVIPAPGAAPVPDDLIAHCRELIAGYKIPRQYRFVDEFPRSPMGKVLKTELRQRFAG
jgi:long-chain acyl-CoA synthetase